MFLLLRHFTIFRGYVYLIKQSKPQYCQLFFFVTRKYKIVKILKQDIIHSKHWPCKTTSDLEFKDNNTPGKRSILSRHTKGTKSNQQMERKTEYKICIIYMKKLVKKYSSNKKQSIKSVL